MKTIKGIRRIDCARSRTRAWHAIVRRASGEIGRTFSDGGYGGRLAAYRAAKAWYEKAEADYPLMTRLARMSAIRTNNRSGVAGVYRWPADGTNMNGAYWAAQWVISENQMPVRRKFSIAH